MQNEKFKAEYELLKPEFEILQKIIETRKKSPALNLRMRIVEY
jgi:hypothetical protein